MTDPTQNPPPAKSVPRKTAGGILDIGVFIAFGVLFGVIFGDIPIGICIGILVGAVMGTMT
jgi:uncharacterized membrane protein